MFSVAMPDGVCNPAIPFAEESDLEMVMRVHDETCEEAEGCVSFSVVRANGCHYFQNAFSTLPPLRKFVEFCE